MLKVSGAIRCFCFMSTYNLKFMFNGITFQNIKVEIGSTGLWKSIDNTSWEEDLHSLRPDDVFVFRGQTKKWKVESINDLKPEYRFVTTIDQQGKTKIYKLVGTRRVTPEYAELWKQDKTIYRKRSRIKILGNSKLFTEEEIEAKLNNK